jgi:hypothetical protein
MYPRLEASVVAAASQQLEQTVMRHHVRAAGVPLQRALAARWEAKHAATQLQRSAA